MIKKILKKFLIILISCSLSLSALTTIVVACGGGDWFEFFDSFFAPEVSAADKYKPFYSSILTFYDGYYGYHKESNNHDFDSVNVEEWSEFFKGAVSAEDLRYLLYESELGAIDTLIFYLKNNQYPIRPFLKKNTLLQVSDKTAAREFLFYLGFAKRCEAHSVFTDGWYGNAVVNVEKKPAADLIKGATTLLKSVKNQFIRERYFFQIARLHFFNENYNACVNYYNKQVDSMDAKGTMRYRAMGYAAGSLKRLGETAKANYLYSLMYDANDVLKTTAFLSFAPQEEDDWAQGLVLAHNTREKTVLWHMLGIKADPLRAMQQIYKLDPKTDLLEVLLVRAINSEESSVINVSYGYSDQQTNELKKVNINASLKDFIVSVADKGNTLNPYIWNLAAGYIKTLAGEYKNADQFLSKAQKQVKDNSLVLEQIRLTRLIAKAEQYTPSAKSEADIAAELKWLNDSQEHPEGSRSQNLYNWLLKRLSEKYAEAGDLAKAAFLNSSRTDNFLRANEMLDKLLAYHNKKDKTDFDKFLISIYPYDQKDIYDMQGVNLLYQHKFPEAREKFLLSGSTSLESDPFSIRLIDCRDCDQAADFEVYTKVQFIDKMLELDKKAAAEPAKAFDHYFKLANGYYNMTYFGNSRNLYLNEMYYPGLMYFYDINDLAPYLHLLDCSKAEEFYIKAMNATTNKELKAKCAFMAAKCEQNIFFITHPQSDEKNFQAGKYFKILKAEYATTKYYKEIIKECGYFKTYLNTKK